MLPLRDNVPSSSIPIVNYLMIAVCTVVFFLQLAEQSDREGMLVEKYGMIPQRVRHPGEAVLIREAVLVPTSAGMEQRERTRVAAAPPFSPLFTLLTCIFLHGGWMHFLGNMWFLHIFGDNVEDTFGHVKYFLLYLAWGIFASAAHLLTNINSTMPTIGASGAIAGVMGAYLWLHPHGRVLTLIPLGLFSRVVELPASWFLGIWFVLQLLSGSMSVGGVEAAGVAWWAHIGGFVIGFVSAYLLGVRSRGRLDENLPIPETGQTTYRRPRDNF